MSPLLFLVLPHHLLLVVVLLVVSFGHGTPTATVCSHSFLCGGINISYPFHLDNQVEYSSKSYYCGYPSMMLSCINNNPILALQTDNYTVTSINYDNRTITVVDIDVLQNKTCPRVQQNVTFTPASRLDFTPYDTFLTFFFGCSFSPSHVPPNLIPCSLAGYGLTGHSFVFPTTEISPEYNRTQMCPQVVMAPVLTNNVDTVGFVGLPSGFAPVLQNGFQLGWDQSSGDCRQCEASNGMCGYNQTVANTFLFSCFCPNGQMYEKTCNNQSGSGANNSAASNSSKTGIIIGITVAAVAVLLLIICLLVLHNRKLMANSSSKLFKHISHGSDPRSMDDDMESGSVHDLHTHVFAYEELEKATNGFDTARELGDGGFGTVYKGKLRDGRTVAVKRLHENSYKRMEHFVNEAAILSLLRHPNLVAFYGCTSRRSRELLLVYEFVPNGTLADHIHGSRAHENALTWPVRLSIAIEAADALAYLHAIEPPVVHRDVKTNNILLDANFHVKVADFGLSRLFPLDVTHVSTLPQGTPGYVDPEYHRCYQLTDKSDVYSFGVVLVELVSSKPAVDITRSRSEINLAYMAVNKIQSDELDQLVDMELGFNSDPETKRMMTMVMELAFRCLQQDSEMRPPIKEVLDALRGIQQGHRGGNGGGEVDADEKGLLNSAEAPFSPDSVTSKWESRLTTPNNSK